MFWSVDFKGVLSVFTDKKNWKAWEYTFINKTMKNCCFLKPDTGVLCISVMLDMAGIGIMCNILQMIIQSRIKQLVY